MFHVHDYVTDHQPVVYPDEADHGITVRMARSDHLDEKRYAEVTVVRFV